MMFNASVTLRYALYRLQLAHTVGECILRREGSDALFPNDFGEDLLMIYVYGWQVNESVHWLFIRPCKVPLSRRCCRRLYHDRRSPLAPAQDGLPFVHSRYRTHLFFSASTLSSIILCDIDAISSFVSMPAVSPCLCWASTGILISLS